MTVPRTLSEVRGFVTARGFHPARARGQNFLVDANILDILLAAAAVGRGDTVLEVGPGLGVLTAALLDRGAAVVAIEKDRVLAGFLEELIPDAAALTLRVGDALDVDLPGLLETAGVTALVANLPYQAGSRILVELAGAPAAPPRMVVTVQREVAARLTAAPGGRQCGLLTVWCGYRYDCVLRHVVSANCFWPKPAVNSAIVSMTRVRERLPSDAEARFYARTAYAFKHRRKQLASTLARAGGETALPGEHTAAFLAAQGLPAAARPEDLSVEHWRALASVGQGAGGTALRQA